MSDFERIIGFGDNVGTRAKVTFDAPDDDNDEPGIYVTVEAGYCGGRGFPTPDAARQLAAALLDAADEYDKATGA